MLTWDQHTCLPLDEHADVTPLLRHRAAGASYVSVNVGFAPHGIDATMRVLRAFRERLLERPDAFVLAVSAEDVLDAHRTGRLAVGFDLEDTNPLEGRLEMIQEYYDLGVRSMLLTYNGRNLAGHGCHDDPAGGLTDFGRAVVAGMNATGMMVDASHCSLRSSLEICEVSEQPVIFSHSSMRALRDHERNITDEQVLGCAQTGGVVGINGVGIFLGANDTRTDTVVRHIDHAVNLVGPHHVGLGLDYVFDNEDLNRELRESPELFPESYRTGSIDFVRPEQLPAVADALHDLGYADADVAAVMGGNFLRVAQQVWKPPLSTAA